MEQKLDLKLFELIFDIDYSIDLSKTDKEFLIDLQDELKVHINEYGEEGEVRIKEIVLNTLMEYKKDNLAKYLSLEIEESIGLEIDKTKEDDNFKRIENKDKDEDFFKSYLVDEALNDLYFTWKGYTKKNEGSKEVFIKTRCAIIPKQHIDSLYTLLLSNFNKINFVSDKEDEEQARLIMFTLNQAFEILLEIPYFCCDTTKTVEILSSISLKMCNLIGYSKGNRESLFSSLSDSYLSKEDRSNKKTNKNTTD